MSCDSNVTQPLFCPLLASMLNHSLHNNTRVNLAVVSVHGLVSILGILENVLVLWVVGFRVRRTVVAVWVINLALSDFLATLTLPLFTYYMYASHSWNLGQPLCTAQSAIFFINMFISAFLLAVISLDRCLLVVRPVWSQNHRSVGAAWKVCGLGWLWAAANALPYLPFRSVMARQDGRRLCYHNFALYSTAARLERDCRLRQDATAVSKLLLAFLAPLAVIAVSYVWVSRTLRERAHRRTRTSSSSSSVTLSHSFAKMAVAVVTAFVLCWSPYHSFCMLELASQNWAWALKVVEVGLPLVTTLAFLNSVLNPILYAFSCPHFSTRIRESLGALLEGLVEEEEAGAGKARSVCSGKKGLKKRRDTPASNILLSTHSSMSNYNFKHCQ